MPLKKLPHRPTDEPKYERSMPPGGFRTVDELTWTFVDNEGLLLRRELVKVVLSVKGKWGTILYLYQDNNYAGKYGYCNKNGTDEHDTWQRPKAAIVRYEYTGVIWMPRTQISLGFSYWPKIIDKLSEWYEIVDEIDRK